MCSRANARRDGQTAEEQMLAAHALQMKHNCQWAAIIVSLCTQTQEFVNMNIGHIKEKREKTFLVNCPNRTPIDSANVRILKLHLFGIKTTWILKGATIILKIQTSPSFNISYSGGTCAIFQVWNQQPELELPIKPVWTLEKLKNPSHRSPEYDFV